MGSGSPPEARRPWRMSHGCRQQWRRSLGVLPWRPFVHSACPIRRSLLMSASLNLSYGLLELWDAS